MCLLLGDDRAYTFRYVQSICLYWSSEIFLMSLHHLKSAFRYKEWSIISFIFVDILTSFSFNLLTSRSVGVSTKAIRPLFCIETILGYDNLRAWSYSHRCFAAMLQRTFKDAHLSRGTMWSSWWPFTRLHIHIVLDSSVILCIAVDISKWLAVQDKEEN